MEMNIQFLTKGMIDHGANLVVFLALVPDNCIPPVFPVPVFANDVLTFYFHCVDITNASSEFVPNLFVPVKEVFRET